jgi:outer membrane protein assembly factor BamB
LGDGYSSIVSAKGRLFTMYRSDEREHVVALDAQTGKTLWQHRYEVQFLDGTDVEQFGPGPLSTPLVIDDRVCTVGVTGVLHCLDINEGTVLWKHDLIGELGGTNLYRGYSASPIAYRDMVILPVGGPGRGLVSFRIRDGSVVWQNHEFAISHVSPIMIQIGDDDQLVVLAEKLIAGFDPLTGQLVWQHAHPIDGGYVSSTPVWGNDGRLFFSAAYGEGSRCLLLHSEQGKTVVNEIWQNGRMRVHHSNVVRVGDVVYGSSGDFAALLFTALDVKSGKLLWRRRQLGRANCVHAGGRFIVLREDGMLMLATMTPKELIVHSKVKLFDGRAWTAPSLDGNRLYIRNRTEVMALELPEA